jgi:hypothetical protein
MRSPDGASGKAGDDSGPDPGQHAWPKASRSNR